jgi:hypothetical protein
MVESWWGEFALVENETRHWQIGPSLLWLSHLNHEWRLYHKQLENPLETTLKIYLPASADEIDQTTTQNRFSFSKTTETIQLMPSLADRPIIIRPEHTFYVPSQESVMLYVSTPIWINLQAHKPLKDLLEFPSYRPSDTWFGPSTLEGELCYAARTTAKLNLSELEFRPHRAITPIRIRNRASEPLKLERVKVPLPYLSLYAAEDQRLWTQLVSFERQDDGDFAQLNLAKTAPPEAGPCKRLAKPRHEPGKNVVVRTFSKLFRSE